jgi:hypothetical protein
MKIITELLPKKLILSLKALEIIKIDYVILLDYFCNINFTIIQKIPSQVYGDKWAALNDKHLYNNVWKTNVDNINKIYFM